MGSEESKTIKVTDAVGEGPGNSSADFIAKTDLIAGTLINSLFKVEALLGRGGMGSVYRVANVETNVMYALKCLDKQQTNDATWRRFDLEARAANRLDHPNLIKVYDSGLLANGQPYFIMDLVEGETLAEVLKRSGRLPLDQVLKIFIQVGFAISCAHENGIVHRDIKPSNIMLEKKSAGGSAGSSVKLVDFGIAKLTGKDEFNQQTLTKTGEIFGSPLYMSPEQCLGTGVDQRSDLYAIGCVIYEALTGAPPIVGDSALSTMMKHQTDIPLSLKEASMGIEFPERIESIVAKLLTKDPDSRYQSANVLTEELVSFANMLAEGYGSQSLARKTTASSLPKAKTIRREPALILLAILIFAAGFAAGCFYTQLQKNQEVSDLNPLPDGRPSEGSAAEMIDNVVKPSHTQGHADFRRLAEDGNKFSTLSKDKASVVFSFPNLPVGELRITNLKGNVKLPNMLYKNGVAYGQALGEMPLPSYADVYFVPSFEFKNNPRLFAKFGRDDLAGLDFTSTSIVGHVLDDSHVDIDAILPYITHLKRLKSLRFDNTGLSDKNLKCLNQLPHLSTLHLNNTRITAPGFLQLKILGQLKWLKIKGMKDTKLLIDQIRRFEAIEELYLENCNLDAEDVGKLNTLIKLSALGLGLNQKVDDHCLDLLPTSLSKLSMHGCNITPACIGKFKRFKNLRQLCLPQRLWTENDLKQLHRLLPKLEVDVK